MAEPPALSLAEWVVLVLLDERPRHGFAVAALTAESGEVGRAWQIPRPIVYRCMDRLVDAALVEVSATESGGRGPQRSVMSPTDAGRAAARSWLDRPVGHVRDVRSELLVKLALLDRLGRDPSGLIAAQREVFAPVQAALERRRGGEAGFDQVLAGWRAENVGMVLRFLDGLR